jgi:Uma2 family endonuclease
MAGAAPARYWRGVPCSCTIRRVSTSQSPAVERLITGDELFEMGDIGPCELVDGRIVPMTRTGAEHGAIESRLTADLVNFVRRQRAAWVLSGEAGLYTKHNPDSVRGADIVVVSKARLPNGPGKRFLDVAPELVVEIMSPDDRWQDVRQKISEYFAIGVDRVWIVEPANRSVLVFMSPTESRQLTENDDLKGEGPLHGFSVRVAHVFAD